MTKSQERVSEYIETLLKMRDNAPVGAVVVNDMDRSDTTKTLENLSATVVTVSGGHPDVILSSLHEAIFKKQSLVALNVLCDLDKKIVDQLQNINSGAFQGFLAGKRDLQKIKNETTTFVLVIDKERFKDLSSDLTAQVCNLTF